MTKGKIGFKKINTLSFWQMNEVNASRISPKANRFWSRLAPQNDEQILESLCSPE